jgi:Tfp pilus assembly protein PilO
MVLRDVRYNALQEESSEDKTGAVQGGQVDRALNSDYGSWDLEFSITSNYNNFLNFTKDLENNLRIVDISSIQFSSGSESKTNPSLPEVYKFSFKIKTYWLKN